MATTKDLSRTELCPIYVKAFGGLQRTPCARRINSSGIPFTENLHLCLQQSACVCDTECAVWERRHDVVDYRVWVSCGQGAYCSTTEPLGTPGHVTGPPRRPNMQQQPATQQYTTPTQVSGSLGPNQQSPSYVVYSQHPWDLFFELAHDPRRCDQRLNAVARIISRLDPHERCAAAPATPATNRHGHQDTRGGRVTRTRGVLLQTEVSVFATVGDETQQEVGSVLLCSLFQQQECRAFFSVLSRGKRQDIKMEGIYPTCVYIRSMVPTRRHSSRFMARSLLCSCTARAHSIRSCRGDGTQKAHQQQHIFARGLDTRLLTYRRFSPSGVWIVL